MIKQKGFSIFEILIVISLFVLIVSATNQAFFAALRSQSKTDITSLVKQNGQYVTNIIERALHSAQSVSTCTATSINYLDSDGKSQSFVCQNNQIVQSGSAISTPNVFVSACNFSCSQSGGKQTVFLDMLFSQFGSQDLRPEDKSQAQIKTQIRLRN